MLDTGEVTSVTPYWDVELKRDRSARIALIRELADIGLVNFQLRIFCRASLFFVDKKGVQIRIIVDGREASLYCRRPPYTPLGSAGAWSEVDLSAETLEASGVPGGAEIHGAAADLSDGFHQFTHAELGSLFGFDFPELAQEYGCTSVYDPATHAYFEVSPDTRVFPVYVGLPMGWSWSLHFCQQVLADSMATGIRAVGLTPVMLLEKEPAPPPSLDAVFCAPYVDNANLAAFSRDRAALALRGVLAEFDRRHLVYHEVVEATTLLATVGVVLDFSARRLEHNKPRVWRVDLALSHVLKVGGTTGFAMRILLGHIVNLFMLLRPALALLDLSYDFVTTHAAAFGWFSEGLTSELQMIQSLLPLTGVQLDTPWSKLSFCSDASLFGFALAIAPLAPEECCKAARFRERWRFVDTTPAHGSEAPLGMSAEFEPACVFPAGAATRSRPQVCTHDDRRVRRRLAVDSSASFCPLDDSVLTPERWQWLLRGGFEFSENIMVLEGRTTLLGLRHAGRDPRWHGCRILSITDNLSSLFAFEKMRSRNRALLWLCRRAAAYILACGLIWRLRYSESKRNPTDTDSRLADEGLIAPGVTQHGPRFTIDSLESELPDARRPLTISPLPAFVPVVPAPTEAVTLSVTAPAFVPAQSLSQVGHMTFENEFYPPPGLEVSPPLATQAATVISLAELIPDFSAAPSWRPQLLPCGTQRNLCLASCHRRMELVARRAASRSPRIELVVRRAASRPQKVVSVQPPAVVTSQPTPVDQPQVTVCSSSFVCKKAKTKSRPVPPQPRAAVPAPSTRRPAPRPRVFLEIFAGRARLTGAVAEAGLAVGPSFELERGVWFDICNERILQVVLGWLRAGLIWMTHLAPPCSFFSLAPDERKRARLRTTGLRCARSTVRILRVCKKLGVSWSVENPLSSRIWTWGPLHRFLTSCRCHVHRLDYCEFGMHYKKPTIFCSDRSEFSVMSRHCAGGHTHDQLAGTVKLTDGTRWKTSLACAYPVRLAHEYAAVLRDICPPDARVRNGRSSTALRFTLGTSALRRAVVRGSSSRLANETVLPAVRESAELDYDAVEACPQSEGRRWPRDAPSWGGCSRFVPPRGRRPQYYECIEAQCCWRSPP